MNGNIKIKTWNCPFCKSEKTTIVRSGQGYFGLCNVCQAKGPIRKSDPEAAEAWNLAQGLKPSEDGLAPVAGRRLSLSLADFEMRCRTEIGQMQTDPFLDNSLLGLLCEAVRLAREYADLQAMPAAQPVKEIPIILETLPDNPESPRTWFMVKFMDESQFIYDSHPRTWLSQACLYKEVVKLNAVTVVNEFNRLSNEYFSLKKKIPEVK